MNKKIFKKNFWILILAIAVLIPISLIFAQEQGTFLTPSIIKNTRPNDVTGNLTIKVQKLDEYSCPRNWIDIKTVIENLELTIPANDVLELPPIWNAYKGYVAEESGHFRVYAEFKYTYYGDLFIETATAEFSVGELPLPECPAQECIDSDNGLNYYIKGGGIGTAEELDGQICAIVLGKGEDPTEIFPSNRPYSIYFDHCINNKNLSETYCELDALRIKNFECPFWCLDGACLTNIKDHSKYSEENSKHAFLISNLDPRLIQQIKPVVKWIENRILYEYPLLIYDGTNTNEIINILNELEITKVTAIEDEQVKGLIEDLPDDLNLLIEVINEPDIFSFWLTFIGLVYVEDNPILIEKAADYASSLNAPLIIQGTPLKSKNIFKNKYVICIGDSLSEQICDEYKK